MKSYTFAFAFQNKLVYKSKMRRAKIKKEFFEKIYIRQIK